MSRSKENLMESTIARILLEIGAVSLRIYPPFTWASGRLSPIYCDNRMLMSYPQYRNKVARGFATLLEQKGYAPEVVAGTATAGIPHAAWLSNLLELPMVYVRGQAKQHGKESRIEGRLTAGQKVVLVEDLISTGTSSIGAAVALKESGAELLGVVAIFTYGLDVAEQRFAEADIPWAALTNFNALMADSLARGALKPADQAILTDWQKDPAAWSKVRGGAG